MKFDCYSCGARLGAFPSMDALSVEQASIVGDHADIEGAMKRLTLVGTPFEGMSAGSFCAFCFQAIATFPRAFDMKAGLSYELYAQMFPTGRHLDKGAWVNRRMVLGAITLAYDRTPFDLYGMLNNGIELEDVTCAFPTCEEHICWAYHGQYNGLVCRKHDFAISDQAMERVAARFFAAEAGHDFRECRGDYRFSDEVGHYVVNCRPCDLLYTDTVEDAWEEHLDSYWN